MIFLQNFIYDFLFIVFSIFILFKTISYGVYEIKGQKNKVGGFSIIIFSILVVIFFTITVILK